MRSRWILAAILLCGTILRLPSLRVDVLNEDEALYAAGAVAMQEGSPPYRAWTDSKPPGIFYAYQAAFELAGRYRMDAVHALTIAWVLATALLLARVLGAHARPWAALFFLVFTTVQRPSVLATQAEILYALPLVVAAGLVARPGSLRAFLAGVAVGVGTLLKPTAIALLLAACTWLLLRRRPAAARAAALVAGFAAVWCAAWAFFTHLGVWDDLVFYTFRWPLALYIPVGFEELPWSARFVTRVVPWLLLLAAPWTLAATAVVGAVRRRDGDGDGGPVALLALWTVAALVMLALGGRFFDQYFPAAVTPVAALAGIGAARLERPRHLGLVVAGTALPALLCFTGAMRYQATMASLGEDVRPAYAGLARYVRERTRPEDRVFVWGYFPLIYLAADRVPASRFVAANLLTGYSVVSVAKKVPAGAEDRYQLPGGFDQLLADLEASRAEIIVDTAPADFHHFGRYPLSRYPRLLAYVEAGYVREAERDGAVIYRRRSGTPP